MIDLNGVAEVLRRGAGNRDQRQQGQVNPFGAVTPREPPSMSQSTVPAKPQIYGAPIGITSVGAPPPTAAANPARTDGRDKAERPDFSQYVPQALVKMLLRFAGDPRLQQLLAKPRIQGFGLTPEQLADPSGLYTKQMAKHDWRRGNEVLAPGSAVPAGYDTERRFRGNEHSMGMGQPIDPVVAAQTTGLGRSRPTTGGSGAGASATTRTIGMDTSLANPFSFDSGSGSAPPAPGRSAAAPYGGGGGALTAARPSSGYSMASQGYAPVSWSNGLSFGLATPAGGTSNLPGGPTNTTGVSMGTSDPVQEMRKQVLMEAGMTEEQADAWIAST